MTLQCYGQRLLNPFRGVMQVIRHGAAEAVSLDGIHWDIYVANDQLLDGLGASAARAQVSDIRYGRWSAQQGLRRGAIYPSADFRRMERLGQVLHEWLCQDAPVLPFPLRDQKECWLLDHAGAPLALLHSLLPQQTPDTGLSRHWNIGQAARQAFHASDLPDAANRLEACINALAGPTPIAQWFLRLPDGGGRTLPDTPTPEPWRDRLLEAAAFPVLLVQEAGLAPHCRQLLHDFHNWQAPWLLCLGDLPEHCRQRLEGQLGSQGERVAAAYRLYPQILNPAAIDAARVAARLAASLGVSARTAESAEIDWSQCPGI